MQPITEIAKNAHVDEKYIEQYGRYKAKIDPALLNETSRENGKLVLVTAISPTPAGEGKTTTTIGLADGLRRIGKDVTVALREPSLGPVFGVKGGAAGGGGSFRGLLPDELPGLPGCSAEDGDGGQCAHPLEYPGAQGAGRGDCRGGTGGIGSCDADGAEQPHGIALHPGRVQRRRIRRESVHHRFRGGIPLHGEQSVKPYRGGKSLCHRGHGICLRGGVHPADFGAVHGALLFSQCGGAGGYGHRGGLDGGHHYFAVLRHGCGNFRRGGVEFRRFGQGYLPDRCHHGRDYRGWDSLLFADFLAAQRPA